MREAGGGCGGIPAAMLLLALALALAPAPSLQHSMPAETSSRWYDPRGRDWASVASACEQAGLLEKRLMNFIIRSTFHDSMSTKTFSTCSGDSTTCGGADSSLLLTAEELVRPENSNDAFSYTAAQVINRIAYFYGISNADALSVCGVVANKVLTGGDWDMFYYQKLKVGKIDNPNPNPTGQLPPPDVSPTDFNNFWVGRGLTLPDGVALLGSHSLVDEQRCYRGRGGNPRDVCDPFKEGCGDVKMFKFDNHFFIDACTPSLYMLSDSEKPPAEMFADPPMPDVDDNDFESIRRDEFCKFSSLPFRWQRNENLIKERKGLIPQADPPMPRDDEVYWMNEPRACLSDSLHPIIRANCPHSFSWMYTPSDAKLGMLCQKSTPSTDVERVVKDKMMQFALDEQAWRRAYEIGYFKMVTTKAKWSSYAYNITGRECPSGWVSKHEQIATSTCQAVCPDVRKACPYGCVCGTGFWQGRAYANATTWRWTPSDTPDLPPYQLSDSPESLTNEPVQGSVKATPYFLGEIPGTPYGAPCPWDGDTTTKVNGFPVSPMRFTPFQDDFFTPPVKARTGSRQCRVADGHCLDAYEITIREFQAKPYNKVAPYCANRAGYTGTWLMGFDGMSPGPTIVAPSGVETMVRFVNKINGTYVANGHYPCIPKFKRPFGRPVSVHLHGSGSLPPYDGWADDVFCTEEYKEYSWPNNRATTLWYHDHSFAVTAANCYHGLVGAYIVTDDKTKGSGCGSPFNLDTMEERIFMLGDKLLNSDCQLRLDHHGVHHNNFYGDIITVNGVPWPKLALQPKWYHFRLINTGPSRPYLLKIKDISGNDVSSSICSVVAGDGGWKGSSTAFPSEGLRIGVSERYQVVCNFGDAKAAGKVLFLWNDRDDKFFKDIPMFCYSHLVTKIIVSAAGTAQPPNPQFNTGFTPPAGAFLNRLLPQTDIDQARARAAAGRYDRKFTFGRRFGHWVINGDEWTNTKIAAEDVGANSWELWLLKATGNWIHPVHVHLVDFFVIQRNNQTYSNVPMYEQGTPKDVVLLGPGQKIWVIARFGAHRGDYMFHCHNLMHEDDDMLRAYSIVDSAQGKRLNQGPFLLTDKAYKTIYSNWGYNNPEYGETNAKPLPAPVLDDTRIKAQVEKNLYRIFYPKSNDEYPELRDSNKNAWMFNCPPNPQMVV